MLKNIVKRVLEYLKADKGPGLDSNERLTNKVLLSELTQHFKSELEELSVGRRMIYPMSFNILMHPDDYEQRKDSLPFVLPEIVASFYGVIEDKKVEYPIYLPSAKYWFFQFSSCKLSQIEHGNGSVLNIQKGRMATVASLFTFDIKNASNTTMESNTRLSVKCQNSNVMNNANLNWEAVRNLDILSDGIFTYDFDDGLRRDAQNIMANSNLTETKGLATLSCSQGVNNVYYTMKDDLIHISGKADLRTGRSIFKIDCDGIMDSHVQIKYISHEKKFQIAAYGQTRLNGRLLDLSVGGNVVWYDLANKSHILINEEIVVHFEKNMNE